MIQDCELVTLSGKKRIALITVGAWGMDARFIDAMALTDDKSTLAASKLKAFPEERKVIH